MYQGEDRILECIKKSQKLTLEGLAKLTMMNIDHIRKVIEDLQERGYLKIEEITIFEPKLTEEGNQASRNGIYEYLLFDKVVDFEQKNKKPMPISLLNETEKRFGLPNAKKEGFIKIENGAISTLKSKQETLMQYQLLSDTMTAITNKIKEKIDPEITERLYERKFASKETKKIVYISLSNKQYTLSSGFDINAPSADAPVGKNHPLTKMMKKIKSTFLNLGFTEMESQFIESSFWNFDSLFQPQDHPARELADTFYLNTKADLPDPKLVRAVKKSHEKNWKYTWEEKEAKKMLLRTHTTATSARYLEKLKGGTAPKKYFAIGRVFRNEATDYSHLSEFHQIEGIIVWEKATFRNLLGILKEFYLRLGFEKIRFRPSYFPYTEPSLEIEIFYEPKNTWLELGGAGIFRPEVSIPLCNRYPVLAWGVSLERPLMLAMGIKDVRTIYKNDMDFLRSARI